MAELNRHHVEVNQQSAGRTPSDVPVPTSQSLSSNPGDAGDAAGVKESEARNTNTPTSATTTTTTITTTTTTGPDDDQALEDGTTRSDTDTSRADGSNADAKSTDARPVKKLATTKPVSFAKYSVPKVIAANAGKVAAEKAPASTLSMTQSQPAGRPRLVAKATNSLTQKVKPFRAAAPDPMQVWNKNRVTPQPSTKNLTDEELKQQYGIHLTSRLQSDGDDKEAKWADIDDDEDDWAPETIEWGDGTKTTVNPADTTTTPAVKSTATSKPTTPVPEAPKSVAETKPPTTTTTSFSTSIGPNATVLKVGARAESQQAQKATGQPKGPVEKAPLPSSRTTPAPVPAKSPWAPLPPVDKVAPIEIVPQGAPDAGSVTYPATGHLASASMSAPSPAREISADDFNRSWRDAAQPQLYMPNSGRYESVPDSRRRASRNDQGFRAPAVLQRPNQPDSRAPEPSPAFQTNRTSSDVMRRRTSSTVSSGSGQYARRMSIKSGESPSSAADSATPDSLDQLPASKNSQATTTSAYQARGGDYIFGAGQTDAEIEAQRAQQRQLMREQAELARKRRLEEEARQEAEKRERIRQKLLSLGPDPKVLKAEQEAKAKAEAETAAKDDAQKAEREVKETKKEPAPETATRSPPKPPQPTATGKPQQYGMMKVHPLDTVKKNLAQNAQQQQLPPRPSTEVQNPPTPLEEISPEPPAMNGLRSEPETARPLPDNNSLPEPIPRTNRPVSAASEARAGWGRPDHRTPGNLWGAPHNKALGNGTFDQTLAGYAPQDLSSKASSTGQGWMNGKTPAVAQSPQLGQINQHVPETRSQALQNMTSPEPLPLAMNSEADSMLPVRPPAPIGPPQAQHSQQSQIHNPHAINGFGQPHQNAAVAGWNNFQHVARAQDRAELEQQQRELAARREEEKRTGIRPQTNYNFEETFKQVQLGPQPDQRHISSVVQSNTSSPNMFGAVGSMPPPPPTIGPQSSRGSRFFPQQHPPHVNGVHSPQPPRAVVFHHIEVPRTPSPPPAEELFSSHPAYEKTSPHPIIRFPREKVVVKLPPAKPPTPPAPAPAPSPAPAVLSAPVQPAVPSPHPQQPLTWAARVSMPPPKPVAPVRGAHQPIVQNPSWQERFNGLLGNSHPRKLSDMHQPAPGSSHPAQSALAVTSATKEPLDVVPAGSASVSLPRNASNVTTDDVTFTTKNVEDEEDLFEDREPGSLPSLYFPSDAPAITWPRAVPPRKMPAPPDAQSALIFLGSQWKEDRFPKQQCAIVRAPGSETVIKKDLPVKPAEANNAGTHRVHPRHSGGGGGSSVRRGHRGGRSRPATVKAN